MDSNLANYCTQGSSSDDIVPQLLTVKNDSLNRNKKRRLSVKEIKILRSEKGTFRAEPSKKDRIKNLWKAAYAMVLARGDPWEGFHMEKLPIEHAKRYRYNALKGEWIEDTVQIRLETTPFNHGAMRECFRAKKLSNFAHTDDWLHALNFVAKRYIEQVAPQVYFDDVRLQMDAKLWGEEFSRQPAVSKKVDISQMCVLEFTDRPDRPLYHLEDFIEGTYRKYNSNSGFVDEVARNTPQAFSHFTFERSGHRLIVVDIQGVGDLWTDPQIHTFDGRNYGDGNLGIRGMALFFHTHRCNPLCEALALSQFDLLPTELVAPMKQLDLSSNPSKDDNAQLTRKSISCFGDTVAKSKFKQYSPRNRFCSENSDPFWTNGWSEYKPGLINPADFESHPSSALPFLPSCSPVFHSVHDSCSSVQGHSTTTNTSAQDLNGTSSLELANSNKSQDSGVSFALPLGNSAMGSRHRIHQEASWSSSSTQEKMGNQQQSLDHTFETSRSGLYNKDTELIEFFRAHQAGHRSSSVSALRGADAIILGSVHHELAGLHASGRFASHERSLGQKDSCVNGSKQFRSSNDDLDALAAIRESRDVNWDAVLFHEEQAATLGCIDAIQCLGQYYLELMIDGPLADCPIKPDPTEALLRGLTYMGTAANAGDRQAMIYLAESNYTGHGNSCQTGSGEPQPNWSAAAHWYEMVLKSTSAEDDDSETNGDSNVESMMRRPGYDSLSEWPAYKIYGRLGEIYASGGHGLERDAAKAYEFYESAGDGASKAFKGQLAMKYYEQAALLEQSVGENYEPFV